jgi:hypothetical protein
MGVIIFTGDDTKYKTGNYVTMYGRMTMTPTAPDTTYILHTDKFTSNDISYWHHLVSYRLIVVCDTPPKVSDDIDNVIIDQALRVSKPNYSRSIRAGLCWADRDRAHRMLTTVPLALANSFVKANNNDMRLGRLLAKCKYVLPESYSYAVIAYGLSPVRNFVWPSKAKRSSLILPTGIRQTDRYMDIIVTGDVVSNNLRDIGQLPDGLPKRKKDVTTWI